MFRLSTLLATFLFILSIESTYSKEVEKPLVVVVPSYNNIKWHSQNINSIFMQDYSNYRVVYVDDASEDGTADAVELLVEELGESDRLTLIRNKTRLGSPLANHYNAIHNYCEDHEIVLCLDGDDWFADEDVFNKINTAYSTNDIWVTHGTLLEYPHGAMHWSIPIPKEIVKFNGFRDYRCASHLKTFYAWLFKKIKKEDLMIDGDFFQATGDQALMFPIIEMAAERHLFISDCIYIYNMANPIGESIVRTQLQRDLEHHIRSMKRYKRLKDENDNP